MPIPDGLDLTPFSEAFYEDPYAVYNELRSREPIHKDVNSFYESSWTISDFDTVESLLTDQRLSSDPRTIGMRRDARADNSVTLREPDMMNLDNPSHQRLRSLVQKAFTPTSVARFTQRIEQIADDCIAQINTDTCDIVAAFSKPLPTRVIAEYIGVDASRHADFKSWTDSLLLQGYPLPTDGQWEQVVEADTLLRAYIDEVINARKQDPQDDLITRLITAHQDDELLSEEEVIDMCYLLIGAGNFTTTDLISNCIYNLLSQSIDTLDAAALVEECLRFDSPVLAMRRFVSQDMEVLGQTISRGSVLNLLVAAANHDGSKFTDPDHFNIQRDATSHLSFGKGIHHCLGSNLARAQATIAVQRFVDKWPNAALISSKRSRRMDFRGFTQMQIQLSPS